MATGHLGMIWKSAQKRVTKGDHIGGIHGSYPRAELSGNWKCSPGRVPTGYGDVTA